MRRLRALSAVAALLAVLALPGVAGAQEPGPVEVWRRSPAFTVARYASGLAHASWAAPANPAGDHWDAWAVGQVAVLVRDNGQGTIEWPCGALTVVPSAVHEDRTASAAGPGGSFWWGGTGQHEAEDFTEGFRCGVRVWRN